MLRSGRPPCRVPAGRGAKPIPPAVPLPFSLLTPLRGAPFSRPSARGGTSGLRPPPARSPLDVITNCNHPRADNFSGLRGVARLWPGRSIPATAPTPSQSRSQTCPSKGVAHPPRAAAAGYRLHLTAPPRAPAAVHRRTGVDCTPADRCINPILTVHNFFCTCTALRTVHVYICPGT